MKGETVQLIYASRCRSPYCRGAHLARCVLIKETFVRMVQVSDDGKTIWIVENPKALKGQAGRHVTIEAIVHSGSKSLTSPVTVMGSVPRTSL